MVAELLGQQVGSERGREHAARKQAGFERRGDRSRVDFVFADVGEPLDEFQGEGRGLDVQALADFLAEKTELVWRGEHVGMDDFADDGGKAFERFAQLAYAASTGLCRRWLGNECFSRRWFFASNGGFGLFCLILEELHEELLMIHLLALRSVDALEQSGDETFLDLQLGFEGSNLFG